MVPIVLQFGHCLEESNDWGTSIFTSVCFVGNLFPFGFHPSKPFILSIEAF